MKRAAPIALLAVLVGLVAFLLLRGGGEDDADAVREAVFEIAEGARAGDIAAIAAHVSAGYHDEDGLDSQQLRLFMMQELRRRGGISVVLGPIGVEIEEPGRAHAAFDAALAEGIDVSALELLPTDADALHFEVDFVYEDGDWKVLSHARESISER